MAATPILDLVCDPPPLRRSWIPVLATACFGLALFRWIAMDPILLLPALFASVAVHELGHLLAGKLAGMDTGGVIICGLSILKSGRHWTVRFDPRRLLSGGVAKPLPKTGDVETHKYAWMVAGGPLATLLLAAISGVGSATSGGDAGWLSTFLWLNLVLLVGNLLPMRGLNKTDGARLWLLLRDPENSASWVALLQVMAQDADGVLPRDWDAGVFARMMQSRPGDGDRAYRELLASYRCGDADNAEEALVHVERALAASGDDRLLRHACFLEAVCAGALLRHNPPAARTWLARAIQVRRPVSKFGAEAAIAQSEGRYADAARLWESALAFLVRRKLDSGIARYAKRKFAEYRDQCRQALADAQPAARVMGIE